MLYELGTGNDAFTGDDLSQEELNKISAMLCGSIWLNLVGGEAANVIINAIKDARAAKAVGEIGISAGEKADYKSLFGEMSDEDARLYGEFLENGSTEGLTDAEQEAARKAEEEIILNKIDTDELLKLRGGSEDIHIDIWVAVIL
jgi:hypothetical protein